MPIAAVTATLLGSLFSSSSVRSLFTLIANKRIAEKATLKASAPTVEADLAALVEADLISSAPDGEKYYVTAKGLGVARDLDKILPGG
jgi:predicted transcriptional regulator